MTIDLAPLCSYLKVLDSRGYTRATSGNFSLRESASTFVITRSGLQKGEATVSDFILVDVNGKVLNSTNSAFKPSDEMELHREIYSRDSSASCILHIHSIAGTALSLSVPNQSVFSFKGLEMQKALFGCTSHDSRIDIPIIENSQDMHSIVRIIQHQWPAVSAYKAFYLRGHGIYTWAESLELARRSLEGIEFLFEVEILMIRLL